MKYRNFVSTLNDISCCLLIRALFIKIASIAAAGADRSLSCYGVAACR